MTGDDLFSFVNEKLFPYLQGFKQKASGPNTIEYKIGEIFGEIKNKIQHGYTCVRSSITSTNCASGRSRKSTSCHICMKPRSRIWETPGVTAVSTTPRYPNIRAMVQVVNPKIGERIYDGACGSAGFLCENSFRLS